MKRMIASLVAISAAGATYSHVQHSYGLQAVDWKKDQISQVTSLGIPDRRLSVDGRDCIAGRVLNFNVRDDYAFDIDETVWLDHELYVGSSGGKLHVNH